MRNCKSFHNTLVLNSLYFSLVRSHFEFAAGTYGVNTAKNKENRPCSNEICEILMW